MARKLGDVLHLLLGEEEPAEPAGPEPAEPAGEEPGPGPTGVLACRLSPFDVLEASAAWNLAAAHAALVGPTTWISKRRALGDFQPSGALRQVAADGPELGAAVAAASTRCVWLCLDEARHANEGWLTHTLQFVSWEPETRSRCYRRLEQSAGPGGAEGQHWVITLGTNPGEVRATTAALADQIQERFGDLARVLPLPCEAALYRSWVTRVPICQLAPESRETVALFATVRAISASPSLGPACGG